MIGSRKKDDSQSQLREIADTKTAYNYNEVLLVALLSKSIVAAKYTLACNRNFSNTVQNSVVSC